jgi:hypothetical protein
MDCPAPDPKLEYRRDIQIIRIVTEFETLLWFPLDPMSSFRKFCVPFLYSVMTSPRYACCFVCFNNRTARGTNPTPTVSLFASYRHVVYSLDCRRASSVDRTKQNDTFRKCMGFVGHVWTEVSCVFLFCLQNFVF